MSEDIITPNEHLTLDGLFRERVRRSPDAVAYRVFDRDSKEWLDLTWSAMADYVARWQAALAGERLAEGDRIAIMLRNGRNWVAVDQAAQGLGLVVVPLYMDDRPDNVAYIVRDSAVKLMVVQDAIHWKRLAPALAECPSLQRVVIVGDVDPDHAVAEVVSAAQWLPPSGGPLARSNRRPKELASIVYTSGTTGRPKGVMLSHHNMLSVAHAGLIRISVHDTDLFLSFLPLSHTLERTAGYYLPMMSGSAVAFSRSVAQLADDLQSVRPTILIAVPRIFEKVYGRIQQQLEKGPALKRRIFNYAVRVGWYRFEREQGRRGWHPRLLFWPFLEKKVGATLKEKLGGRLRLAVSGGAALPPEIARTFIGLALPIIQGYGLTETSPVISVNDIADNEPASVGPPLPGIEVRIGEDNELQVRSPGVMLGYWNNHSATSAMIDPEGWLATGDQAEIRNGKIYITGRIKDILVLSNGEKIPPGDMEMALCLDPLFEQALVVGEGRAYLTAIIVLNADLWPGFAQDLGLDPLAPGALHKKAVTGAVTNRLRHAIREFPSYAKIRRFHLTLEPWTVDNGMLTPTMKIKRREVLNHYAQVVDRMYSGEAG